ncbi:MAG: Xaa-Pro peptidase family protein [Spirochaetaceae bacterium]|jgi:Xaa-Pro dipeptidase|nr:Xaa-Pro peptidase family protein [Spirochaetaceae bacterium]
MEFQKRLEALAGWMRARDIHLLMLSDHESCRDPAIRYLTGHPSDALLFLHNSGKTLLVPWDKEIAALYAHADTVLPYTGFNLETEQALAAAVEFFGLTAGANIEIPDTTSYPAYLKLTEKTNSLRGGFSLICREKGAGDFIRALRSIKDETEIALLRKAAALTDEIAGAIETAVREDILKTESDVALFIEAECRKHGCEGTSFSTLAAGPQRSFAIHAFPGYTGGLFAAPGFSILDFGLNYQGYASDITLTFARGALNAAQTKQLNLVKDAFNLVLDILNGGNPPECQTALAALKNLPAEDGMSARLPALAVDEFFGKAGYAMPHGLGHGIGLEVHENPYLRSRESNTGRLKPGMVFTVEPGLYSPDTGGVRYENDILLTAGGAEILTHSKIVLLP